MKITFLGTGTSTGVPQIACTCSTCSSNDPRDKRLRSSVLIESKGLKILIDAGPDLRQQFLCHKITELDAILLTHEHYDHVAGLDDIRPLGVVPVYAESRVLKHIRTNMAYCFSENLYPGVPKLDLIDISLRSFAINNLEIQPIRVMHAHLPILGYRIGNIAYLTDIKDIPSDSVNMLKGLDVLIINALRVKSHISHLNLEEALSLASQIGAKETYFTHFSHDLGLHEAVQEQLPKDVYLSYDNLVLSI